MPFLHRFDNKPRKYILLANVVRLIAIRHWFYAWNDCKGYRICTVLSAGEVKFTIGTNYFPWYRRYSESRQDVAKRSVNEVTEIVRKVEDLLKINILIIMTEEQQRAHTIKKYLQFYWYKTHILKYIPRILHQPYLRRHRRHPIRYMSDII